MSKSSQPTLTYFDTTLTFQNKVKVWRWSNFDFYATTMTMNTSAVGVIPPDTAGGDFFSKIHVLECDSAMEIQSFLFAKSKKIRLRRAYWNAIFIHEPIICRKKGAHIYSWTNYLSRKKRCPHLFMDQLSVARSRGRARALHPEKSQFRIT